MRCKRPSDLTLYVRTAGRRYTVSIAVSRTASKDACILSDISGGNEPGKALNLSSTAWPKMPAGTLQRSTEVCGCPLPNRKTSFSADTVHPKPSRSLRL